MEKYIDIFSIEYALIVMLSDFYNPILDQLSLIEVYASLIEDKTFLKRFDIRLYIFYRRLNICDRRLRICDKEVLIDISVIK